MLRCCNDFDRLRPRERRAERLVQTQGVSQVRCPGGTSGLSGGNPPGRRSQLDRTSSLRPPREVLRLARCQTPRFPQPTRQAEPARPRTSSLRPPREVPETASRGARHLVSTPRFGHLVSDTSFRTPRFPGASHAVSELRESQAGLEGLRRSGERSRAARCVGLRGPSALDGWHFGPVGWRPNQAGGASSRGAAREVPDTSFPAREVPDTSFPDTSFPPARSDRSRRLISGRAPEADQGSMAESAGCRRDRPGGLGTLRGMRTPVKMTDQSSRA